jgi:NADH-quinone oxidoreductase subunit G
MSESSFGYLPRGANTAGACLAGALPYCSAGGEPDADPGLDIQEMFAQGMRAFVLLGFEPEFDCHNPAGAVRALHEAEHVVIMTPYLTEAMRDYADVLLPVVPYTETSGTFVNVEGRWQRFAACVSAAGDARPAWKVLRVLGNLLDLDGFEYLSSEEVHDELTAIAAGIRPDNSIAWQCPTGLGEKVDGVIRIAETPIYAVDGIVRRSTALQNTPLAQPGALYMNPAMLDKLGLQDAARVVVTQGEASVSLTVTADERVPDDCACIPDGTQENCQLGAAFQPIQIEKD